MEDALQSGSSTRPRSGFRISLNPACMLNHAPISSSEQRASIYCDAESCNATQQRASCVLIGESRQKDPPVGWRVFLELNAPSGIQNAW